MYVRDRGSVMVGGESFQTLHVVNNVKLPSSSQWTCDTILGSTDQPGERKPFNKTLSFTFTVDLSCKY